MHSEELRVRQVDAEGLRVERLPDGSTAVFDTRTQTVHSLNVSAAAAFTACAGQPTLPMLAQAMGESLNAPVSQDVALAAISELESAGLVVSTGPAEADGHAASRRSLLQRLGVAAAGILPVVLSLSAAEQKAFAGRVRSGIG